MVIGQKISIGKNMLLKFYNLKNLIRYNPRSKISSESVAEHSFFVALFTLIITNNLEFSDEDKYKCLVKALLHDLPEIDLSDIPHNVKTNFPEINEIVKKAEVEWFKKNFPDFEKVYTNKLQDDIVLLADTYSVIQFCEYEKSLGNQSLYDVMKNAEGRIEILKDDIIDEMI